MNLEDDDMLAERMRRGEHASFAMLTSRYWTAVHCIARNLLADPSKAREVDRVAFVRLTPVDAEFTAGSSKIPQARGRPVGAPAAIVSISGVVVRHNDVARKPRRASSKQAPERRRQELGRPAEVEV
jgi:hypothetical protein